MRDWPPYRPDGPGDDSIAPELLDAEVDRLITALGLAAGPYTAHIAVQAELRRLGELRGDYRRARWVITASWIVVLGFAAIMLATHWWVLALPVGAFTVLAMHQYDRCDVSRERGRELDAAIADARDRMRGLPVKEGR